MEAGAHSLKLSYEDYLYFPDDGKRHEIIDGEHYVTPAPNLKHQTAVVNLAGDLRGFVRPRKLGRVWVAPVDVLLSAHDVVQPDLVFLSRDRMEFAADGANVKGAPDLVVEVLSPRTRRTDAITKRHLYEKYGVSEYWMVDPELEKIEVYRLTAGRYRREAELLAEREDVLTSPLFPGLEIVLAEISSRVCFVPEGVQPHMKGSLIQSDPSVMMGKAVVAGTRITVESLLDKLAAGESMEQILEAHPQLTREAVLAALDFAAKTLRVGGT